MKPNVFNSLASSTTAVAFLLGTASSQASVTLYAEYHLGEAGSLSGTDKLLQDSSVNAKHFASHVSGSVATVGTAALADPGAASGSTEYLDTSATGNQGWFGGATLYTTAPVLPTDDFAFGIYARAASATGGNVAASTIGEVFTLNSYVSGAPKLTLTTSGWQASFHNVAVVGGTGTFTANTWVHLAVIRSGGVSAFYVNGTQVGGTIANAPVIGQPHIGLNPGNTNGFDGLLDEARVVTFTTGEPIANILSVLTNSVVVPPGNNGTWVSTTDGLWSDSSKWQGGVIATDIDRTATFSASGGPIVVDLDSSRTIGNLVFSNANYTIGGANVLTLSRSGIPGISVDTGLTATLATTVGGSVGLQKTGPGTLVLTAPNNSYSGTTTVTGGTLQVGGAGTLGSGTYASPISIASGTTLQYSSSATQTLSGAITGAGGITKDTNNSDLTLSNAGNTHTGITTVSAGRIVATAATHLSSGATSIVQSGTGNLFVSSATAQTISNNFNISTTGYAEPSDPSTVTGAIRSDGNNTFSGTITLSGNSRFGAFGSGPSNSGRTNTISGQITGAGAMSFYGMSNVNNQFQIFILSNPLNNYTGDTQIDARDFQAARSGSVTTLRLGASNVIPNGASAGNVLFNGADANSLTVLDLNGFNETINGLSAVAATGARITNVAAGASVLTIGDNDTTSSFSGTVTDAGAGNTLAITKTGTGTLTFSGINSYSGDTTVSDGTLTLDNPNTSNEASTVTVDTDAFLNLNYLGTDTVGELVIGNTPKGEGEYGNIDSVAPVIPLSQITGSGTITVRLGGFAAWQIANNTNQTIELDHDNDGVSNGVEFFLGGTGDTTGFTTPLPGVDKALDGTLSVTWTKGATYPATAIYGTDYSVETSETLTGAWTPETLGGGNITEGVSDVKYTFPSPLGSKKFARLKVTGP